MSDAQRIADELNKLNYQKWLNSHGANLEIDGIIGDKTSEAALKLFANKQAPAVNDADITVFASRLGVDKKQMKAVATVESASRAYDDNGLLLNLFERHKFFEFTGGRFPSDPYFNHPKWGNYTIDANKDGVRDSWEKVLHAARFDPIAAYMSASWGKFQIMGMHWNILDYPSVWAMVFNMTQSEADQYEALCRFIEHENLQDEMRQISADPSDNIAFVKRYNGVAGVTRNNYHVKLAQQMKG
jgi:hypothetical protein